MENWTFLGATDDVVFKYPHNYRMIGTKPPSPIDILVDYALFGPPVIIHQSALFQQPDMVADLLKREESVIFNMIRHDRLRILSRNKDFSGWPDQAKQLGVNTYQGDQFTEKSFLRDINGFQDLLTDQGKGLLGMPRTDCSSVMHELLMSATQCEVPNAELGLSLIPDDSSILESVLNSYLLSHERDLEEKAGSSFPPTRTHWENAVLETIKPHKGENWVYPAWRCQLMTLANECHHLAHGACIASEIERPIAVNTVLSNRFLACYNFPDVNNAPSFPQMSPPRYFSYEREAVKNSFRTISDFLFDEKTNLSRARMLFTNANRVDKIKMMPFDSYEEVYLRELNAVLGLPSPDNWGDINDLRSCDTAVSVFLATLASFAAGSSNIWRKIDETPVRHQAANEEKRLELVNRRMLLAGAAVGAVWVGSYSWANATISSAVCDNLRLDYDPPGNGDLAGFPAVFESSFTLLPSISRSLTDGCFSYDRPDDSPEITQEADL